MGQDTSGTSLTTTAAAAARKVAYRLIVDWADDGFGSEGSWTDESAYVLSATGRHEAVNPLRSVAPMGRGVSDVVTVVCHNPECSSPYSGLRFSSSNSGGPLAGYLSAGGIFMKRAILEMGFYNGATPERLRQITGYIVDAREDFENRTIMFTLRDRAAAFALTNDSTALYEGYTAKQYLQVLVALLPRDWIAVPDQAFDTGFMVTPYQWCDDETVWDECGIVAEAQGGRIWFDKDGDLHFDDAAHWVKPNANTYDDPTTAQASFTVASFASIQPQINYDLIFNHVIVEYHPRYVGPLQACYSASETIAVRPTGSYADGYLELRAEFRYPVQEVTGYEITAVNGGGVDISDDLLIVRNDYAGYAKLRFTNSNSDGYTAYLTQFSIMGFPLLTEERGKWEGEDAASISTFGRRTLHIKGNPYIQHYRHAEALGQFALARYADPIQRLELIGVPARPWLEVGDRVVVTETLTGIGEEFFIEEISWSFDGKRYVMSLTVVRAGAMFPYSSYFVLGTDVYGMSARYFW